MEVANRSRVCCRVLGLERNHLSCLEFFRTGKDNTVTCSAIHFLMFFGKNEFQTAFNSERISGPFFRGPPHLRIPSSSVKSNNEALIWSNFLSAKTDLCSYLIRSPFAWSSSSSFTSSAIKSFLTLLGLFCKSSQFSSNRSLVDAVFCIDQNH